MAELVGSHRRQWGPLYLYRDSPPTEDENSSIITSVGMRVRIPSRSHFYLK